MLLRDRRDPDRAAAAGSAAQRLPHDRPRRVPRAQHPRRSRPRARAAGVARARRSAARRHVGDAAGGAARGVSRRLPADRRARPAASARRSTTVPAQPIGRGRGGARARRRAAASCASCRARRRSIARCRDVRAAVGRGVDVVPLHGSLPADEQDRAIAGGPRPPRDSRDEHRRDVADGSRRHARSSTPACTRSRATIEDRGIDSLELGADSRGLRRAARRPRRARSARDACAGCGTRPIGCVRTASRRSIASICPTPCSTSSRGAAIRWPFEWFDRARRRSASTRRCALLEQLGAVRGGRVTPLGERMKRLPLHPRLARMLLEVAAAAATSRWRARCCPSGTSLPRASGHDVERPAVGGRRRARRCRRTSATWRGGCTGLVADSGDAAVAPARETRGVPARDLRGYPDRVARRRAPGSPKFLLASGHGAVLGRESGVRDARVHRRRRRAGGAARRDRRGDDPDCERDRPGVADDGPRGRSADRRTRSIRRGGPRARVEREFYGDDRRSPSGRPLSIRRSPARLLAAAYRARGLVGRRRAAVAADALRGTDRRRRRARCAIARAAERRVARRDRSARRARLEPSARELDRLRAGDARRSRAAGRRGSQYQKTGPSSAR